MICDRLTLRLFAARSGGEDPRVSDSVVLRAPAGCLRPFRFAAAIPLNIVTPLLTCVYRMHQKKATEGL